MVFKYTCKFFPTITLEQLYTRKEEKCLLWNIPVHLLHLEIWYAKSRSALWQNSQMNPFAWQSYKSGKKVGLLFKFNPRKNNKYLGMSTGLFLTPRTQEDQLYFTSQPSTWEVELFRISLRRGSNCPRLIFTRSSNEKRCSSSVKWLGTRSNSFSTLQRKPENPHQVIKDDFQVYFQNKPLSLLQSLRDHTKQIPARYHLLPSQS